MAVMGWGILDSRKKILCDGSKHWQRLVRGRRYGANSSRLGARVMGEEKRWSKLSKEQMIRLETLKEYADALGDLIGELAGEADDILGDSRGINSMGDDLTNHPRSLKGMAARAGIILGLKF